MKKGDTADMSKGSGYWRSLKELYRPDSLTEAKANEFMAGVTDEFDVAKLSAMSRSQFLALLTTSAAFAAAGCSNYRDRGEIVPYTKQPEGVTPGIANYYASTCSGCAQSCGVLVKTREGRPIKIDGNPDHPINRGKICPKGQAGVLQLYDPYRLRGPQYGAKSGRNGELTWEEADKSIIQHLKSSVSESKEIAIVAHPNFSPTSTRLFGEFLRRYPTARIYTYDVFHEESREKAWQRCYGSRRTPAIQWDKADLILALESDFLGTEELVVEQTRLYASRRDAAASSRLNRLYCVEGTYSLTGTNADYRLRLRPDAQFEFVLSLLNELGLRRQVVRLDRDVENLAASTTIESVSRKYSLKRETLTLLADDLVSHRGRALVHAGRTLSESVHVLVNYLNEILGNTSLLGPATSIPSGNSISPASELRELSRKMQSGAVGAVIHIGTNPVYHFPEEFAYRDGLSKVPLSVCLTESLNETSDLCTYVLPVHHALESWGDFAVRGIYSLRQPMIAPLYDTRQSEAVVMTWMTDAGSFNETMYHAYLKNHWERSIFPTLRRAVDFETFWNGALHDGVVLSDERGAGRPTFRRSALGQLSVEKPVDEMVIHFVESYFVGDGRFANNGWLQELPHPVSKIVWDNYAALSPATAEKLGVESNDLIEVSVAHGKQVFPVFVQPGLADDMVSVALGYGRKQAGPIGTGVGTDATPILNGLSFEGARFLHGQVQKTAGQYELVSTQEHHSLDDARYKDLHKKRNIIREGTLAQYRNDPLFLKHDKHELQSITAPIEYNGVKWAMAIDLNKCTGCNACVSSCNVENNVPVVGKEQVKIGRELQWLRIDRYFSGTPSDPTTSHQPMLCQHCDDAPCEKVCPVVATTHSPDGLNQMTYNRCVGTKYCSNNCPYKVRRFNFYDYRDFVADGYYEQEPISLQYNPEVTVRSRGVMEKCSFCVQRIAEARQHAIEQNRPLRGSDVQTACQVACPANAIAFGDMNDPNSEVSRYREHNLGYHVLEEINVKPNVTYLARLKNTEREDG